MSNVNSIAGIMAGTQARTHRHPYSKGAQFDLEDLLRGLSEPLRAGDDKAVESEATAARTAAAETTLPLTDPKHLLAAILEQMADAPVKTLLELHDLEEPTLIGSAYI